MRAQIIAEYTNDQWHDVGKLNQARHGHGSITAGGLTMVLGGSSSDSSPYVVYRIKSNCRIDISYSDCRLRYGKSKHYKIASLLKHYQTTITAKLVSFWSTLVTVKGLNS